MRETRESKPSISTQGKQFFADVCKKIGFDEQCPYLMDNIIENAINIFTDGSSYSAPRKGGMGIRFVVINQEWNEESYDLEILGHKGANSQQMELQACVEAFEMLLSRGSPIVVSQFARVIVNTDSMYVVENFRRAKYEWPRSKWQTRDGTPVANAQIWKELVKKTAKLQMPVEFRWVKGHKSSVHNKAADKLAKSSARGVLRPPLSIVSVRRKKTYRSIDRGSVILIGQRLTIRVITDEYLKVQRCYKFKYEVMSKSSLYFGNVDIAYSEHLLRAGHTYFVQMNKDSKNPRILKKYREVAK